MDKISHRQRDRPPGESVVHRIVNEVAAREGVEPTELRPIATVLDVDALESLVGDHKNFRGTVSFTYLDYEVTVERDETVTVTVAPA